MKRTLSVILVCLALLAQVSCVKGESANTTAPAELASDSWGEELQQQEDLQLIAQTASLNLYINPKTAAVAVENRQTGYRWYSNPPASEENGTAAERSQVTIQYFDDANSITEMTSYEDAVELGQYYFSKADNGIRVTYELGQKTKIYVIPPVISEDRFQKKILSKLDESDAETVLMRYNYYSMKESNLSDREKEELLAKYPKFKDENIYVLNDSLADFVLKKLENIISTTGYTLDDLAFDREYHSLGPVEESKVVVIPVEYRLEDGSFVAEIIEKDMSVPTNVTLTQLEFLRYFGAADSSQNGYMVVPDGSGALIYLNNKKGDLLTYSSPVYGGTDLKKPMVRQQQVNLPVYGMKQGDNSFLAVIESGDAAATLKTSTFGESSTYNTIYCAFELTRSEKMSVSYSDTEDLYVFSKERFPHNIRIRYLFQKPNEADYIHMALDYQDYLAKNGFFAKSDEIQDNCFSVEFLGSVDYQDSILGIPVKRQKKLTGFKEAQEIIASLQSAGVGKMAVRYLGWANGGLENYAMKNIKIEKVLGSKKDLSALMTYAGQQGIPLYFDLNLALVYRTKLLDGYSTLKDSPKTILGENAIFDIIKLSTEEKDGIVRLVKPGSFESFAGSAKTDLNKFGINRVSLSNFAKYLYADYKNGAFVDRQASWEYVQKTIDGFKKDGYSYLADGGNLYSLYNANGVVNLPESSSGHYLFDKDIPFYQTVIRGKVSYTGSALNMQSDTDDALLKLVEYGSGIHFTWMAAENLDLQGIKTPYYGTSYREWFTQAVEMYKSTKDYFELVKGQKITGHEEIANGVYLTKFQNGVSVYVNYGTEEFGSGDVKVPGKGFVVKEGD